MLNERILDKFFKGEASKAEIEQIADYLFSDDADEDLRAIIAEEFASKGIPNPLFDKDKSISLILSQIRRQNTKTERKIFKLSHLRVAAAVSILFLLGFLLIKVVSDFSDRKEYVTTSPSNYKKSTEKGQKLHVRLPDGSLAVLNSMSSIEYPSHFEEGKRSVKLAGEAFFEVRADPSNPFEVASHGLKIKALGTSFNVNNRSKENTVVALIEGKLDVENNSGEQAILSPGEMVRAMASGIEKSNFDYQSVVGWKDGWLIFQEDDFEEIKEKLELWYGVVLEIENSSGMQYHYSGKYQNKSLKETLDGISYVMNFDYEIKGDKVNIYVR